MCRDQDRETLQSNNKNLKIKFLCWTIGIVSVIFVGSHNFFSPKSIDYENQYLKYNNIINNRNNAYVNIKDKFNHTNDLNNKEFKKLISDYIELQDLSTKEFKILSKMSEENKILNFKNTNVFLFQFSIFLVIFCISLLFKFITLQIENKMLSKTYNKVSYLFIFISLYYISWIFYFKSDIPYFAHLSVVVLFSVLMSFVISYLIKWLQKRSSMISINNHNIKNLWRFIILDIPKKHIQKNKTNEYIKDYAKQIEAFKI